MPRSYIQVGELLDYFIDADGIIMEVDVSQWGSSKQAVDTIRRALGRRKLKDLDVFRRKDKVFVMKKGT